ncbi:MAG TPA: hypothetical protein VFZ01_19990, partial [Geminicoccaceae bacterium]
LLLYSTQTLLAYRINQRYFQGQHWVWCSPYRGFASTAMYDSAVPPSSSPLEIYRNLHQEVRRTEHHSDRINANREGLLKGAESKLRQGVIDDATAYEIAAVLERAERADFAPLLYVIPFSLVSGQVRVVPVEHRAHPLSDEYHIEALHRDCFDVIEFLI